MKDPDPVDLTEASGRRTASARWRGSIGPLVQLVALAVLAMLLGIFVFPL